MLLFDWDENKNRINKQKHMLKEYDVEKHNPRKNPYAKELKKQVTIKIAPNVIEYFKEQAMETGIPYQTLINLYLVDCVNEKKKLDMHWRSSIPVED